MKLSQNINVTGSPVNLVITEDNQSIFYVDALTNKIYRLKLADGEKVELITQANNISKIYPSNEYLYILSRSDNSLIVYNLKEKKLIKTVKVDEKPIDIKVLNNKIYVLNAGADSLSVIDPSTFEIVKTVELKSGGFPKNIIALDSGNKALITNISAYETLVYDYSKDEIIARIPISINVNDMIISQVLK